MKFIRVLVLVFLVIALPHLLFAQEDAGGVVRFVRINSADSIEYKTEKSSSVSNDSNSLETTTAQNTPATETATDESVPPATEIGHISEADTENAIDESESQAKDEKTEVIILLGNVSVSVEDGASLDTVLADKIIYNKTRNTLYAEGNVRYQRTVSGTLTQSFTGDSILFDIKEMSGVFLDGIVQTSAQKLNERQYVIHSELTGYDGSGTIAFKNAMLTSSSSEEPLWSLNASRLWLLPGNEMSFANGYFSIGIVPIFYLPFFYYPSDEMMFHPVFGYKPRGGYFTQTTTYLLGRKTSLEKDNNSTFANFLIADSIKEQQLNGVFFQNLSADAKVQSDKYIKLIADAYSSLGYLVGVEGSLPSPVRYMTSLKFSAYFGFSHTLYPLSSSYGSYTQYNSAGLSPFNESNFFGLSLPFRYNLNFATGISVSPISLQISLPFISDPFFQTDFFARSEDMNWFNFMREQSSSSGTSEQSSYNWSLRFSANPSFKVLLPYIQSISLQNLSLNVLFYSKANTLLTGEDKLYAPDRKFYFPQTIRPEMSFNFSGTLFSTSNLNRKKTSIKINGLQNPFLETESDALTNQNNLSNLQENVSADTIEKNDLSEAEKKQIELTDLFLPLYKYDSALNKSQNIISYDLKYSFRLGFLSENMYDYQKWNENKDINWKDFASHHYKVNYDIQLNSSLSLLSQLLRMSNSAQFTQNHQRTPFIKDTMREELITTNDYRASTFQFTNTNSLTLNPLYFSQMFSGTSLQWSIRETLVRSSFTGTYAAPEWKTEIAKWEKEFITQHNFSSVFAINLNGYTQSLRLVSALPPVTSSFTMSGNFQHPYGSISVDTRVYEKDSPEKKWFWNPLSINVNWKLPYNISTSQSYSYNIEEKSSEQFKFNFGWKYLSLNFLMQRDSVYTLDPTLGWRVDTTNKKFQLKNADISFSNGSSPFTFYFWKNRISLSFAFSTTLSINLQRATESYFSFSPTIQFSIYDFLTLKISAVTRNDVIARYFQNALNLGVTIPGETNVFKDLLQSFYFWDTNARKASGFKLKSLNIELQHDLKDWTMSFVYSFSPQVKYNSTLARNEYSYVPKLTFMVSWKPISDIKVKTITQGEEFTVERGSID